MSTAPKIDPEIAALLPRLSHEELATLESSLREKGGCRESLVVWAEEGILLDGHNRLAICQKYNIKWFIQNLSLPSREAAIQWVIDNQLGRRNLTDERRAYYRGKEYLNQKQPHGGQVSGGSAQIEQSPNTSGKTAERIAEKHGVSPATVRRNAVFAAAVDRIADQEGPAAKEAILAGTASQTKAQVVNAARAVPAKQSPTPAVPAVAAPARQFDIHEFETKCGVVLREIDKLGNTYGTLNRPETERLRSLLRTFWQEFLAHYQKLSGSSSRG
jgi:hypothetical protein